MSFRFRRSIRIAPGLHLNISKSGLGLSAGPRGLHVGLDAKGRPYTSAGIPGTGLSVRQYGSTPGSSAVGVIVGALIGCAVAVFGVMVLLWLAR